MPEATAPHATRIAANLIDWGGQTLVRPDRAIKLTPKAVAVLQLLLAEPSRTVTRRAIFDTVWPGSYSSDDVLTQVVTELRRAFGDDARDARYIVTIPKLGYRWVGPLPEDAGAIAPATSAQAPEQAPLDVASLRPLPTRTHVLVLVLVLLVGLEGFLFYRSRRADEAPAPVAKASTAAPAPPRSSAPPSLQRPLTNEPGLDLEPDLDHDGRRLAYIHAEGGKVELRVRDVGATAYATLALGEGGTPSGPAWSPDGSALAFVWRTDSACEIRRIALAGGAASTIASGCPSTIPSSIDWSAVGDFIVYSRVSNEDAPVGSRNIAVFRVAPDGSDLRQLSNARRWLVVDGHPRVDARGERVAFARDGDQKNRVFVADTAGRLEEREVPLEVWPYRVAWAGASTSLLVSAHGRTAAELWHVALDGKVIQPVALEAAGPGFAVSPDGAFAVFERHTLDDNIWRRPLSGASTPVQVTRETGAEICPRIAPDGRTLAYLSDESGTREVVLRDLAGDTRKRLSSFAPLPALDLRWSPRGDHLAVIVGTSKGKRLALLTADGTALPLPDRIASWTITQADWTHDQSHLLLSVAADGRRELWRVRFPQLAREEMLLDTSVGWFDPAQDSDHVFLTSPRNNALETMGSASSSPKPTGTNVRAAPADQWTVRGDTLAEMTQVESGTEAEIRLRSLAEPGATTRFRIAAPFPPLGRNFDLGAAELWYASRDVDEADLVRVDLAPGAASDASAASAVPGENPER